MEGQDWRDNTSKLLLFMREHEEMTVEEAIYAYMQELRDAVAVHCHEQMDRVQLEVQQLLKRTPRQ